MAKAFPSSSFVGYDFHAPSIEQANSHAKAHGLADRVRFVTAPAKDITDRDFDLVTMFDCLHDMGDPRGCAKHVRKLLKPSGSWMIVEPIAADHPSVNVGNPVSRTLLQRFDHDLRAHVTRAGGRRGSRRPGGRGEVDRGAEGGRRLPPCSTRRARALQHGARSPAVITGASGCSCRGHPLVPTTDLMDTTMCRIDAGAEAAIDPGYTVAEFGPFPGCSHGLLLRLSDKFMRTLLANRMVGQSL